MRETNHALAIDDRHEWHAPQLEEIHLLLVAPRDPVVGVGKANKGDLLSAPVHSESPWPVGTDCQNLGAAALELQIVVPQTRQLRAAIRSEKTPEEG